jgi:hypothetical protein
MKNILFHWEEQGTLVEYLSRPFDRLAVEVDVVQRPVAVCLVRNHVPTIEISSRMHDVGDRAEVGVLRFAKGKGQNLDGLNIDLPSAFGTVATVEKLVIIEQEVRAESGIVFKNAKGEEIVIVASAWPFGLAISIPWSSPLPKFNPEYDLEQYTRVSVT